MLGDSHIVVMGMFAVSMLIATAFFLAARRAPKGYEDDDGFHYGDQDSEQQKEKEHGTVAEKSSE